MSLLALLLCARALALDWWVPDSVTFESTRAALKAYWPSAAIDVRVGAWPGFGIGGDDGRLWVVADGVDRDEPAPRDVVTRVVLMRAWLHGRAPVDVAPIPLALAPVPRPPRAPGWDGAVGLSAGPGLGIRAGTPPVHAAVVGRAASRSFLVGGAVQAAVGGVLTGQYGQPIDHSRYGALAFVGLRAPILGGDVEFLGGAGIRFWALGDPWLESHGVIRWVPTLGERLGWWRTLGDWRVGIAIVAEVDQLAYVSENRYMRLPDGQSTYATPAAAAIHFGVERRWSR